MSCPVCFTGDDPVVRESLNAGIGVLLGVTGIVLASFARFFVTLARRSRESAHLVGVRTPTPDAHPSTPNSGSGDRDHVGSWELAPWELTPSPGANATEGTAR